MLAIETLVIGLVTAIVGMIISVIVMYVSQPGFKIQNYKFWSWVLLTFFLTGAIIHLAFEALGLNKKFCQLRK